MSVSAADLKVTSRKELGVGLSIYSPGSMPLAVLGNTNQLWVSGPVLGDS